MKILASFEKIGKVNWMVLGFLLIGVVGFLDFLTGTSLTFAAFYMIPIALLTWLVGRRFGIISTVFSVFVWLLARELSEEPFSSPILYFLNTFIEFISLISVALLLSAIKSSLEHEKRFSQTDFLTGAMNSRTFYDFLQNEIRRSNRYRHPFTIAYFDIDDFKSVNDQFGHNVADEVLRSLVKNAKKQLRKTDVIARLGGDEFAVLLPETHNESAQLVLTKIQTDILTGMKQNNWEVTISMGALTCTDCVESIQEAQEIIKMVDDLMYSVKRSGKNAIKYSNFDSEEKNN